MEKVTSAVFFSHIDSFMDYRKIVYESSDQTLSTNSKDIMLFKKFIQINGTENIDGPTVMDYQYYLKEERKNCGGSINRKLFTLRSYSNFLCLKNVDNAATLPFYDVLKIRGGYRNRPSALTKNQVEKLFSSIGRTTFLGIRDYAVYALMYMLGLRVGEVFSLTIDSLDSSTNTIQIHGKGNRIRELSLNNEIASVISEWLAVRDNFMNSEKCNALFLSKKGNPLAIRTIEDNFKKVIKAAEISAVFNVTCHTLRHSFASHLNDNEIDILIIKSVMGHSTTRSTQPYIHPSIVRIKEALEKLPGVIFMKQLMEGDSKRFSFQKRHKV